MSAIILSKVRESLVDFITNLNLGCAVYDEKNSTDKAAPNVSCGAANAVEDPVSSGNFWVDAVVSVKTKASVLADGVDPKTASETLIAAVLDALEVTDLAAQLTALVSDFTVFGVGEEKQQDLAEDGDCWIESLKIRLYCCSSVV